MVRHVRGQGELALFTDPEELVEVATQQRMTSALASILEGDNAMARFRIDQLTPADRYRLRVAYRILILEAAKQERTHPS